MAGDLPRGPIVRQHSDLLQEVEIEVVLPTWGMARVEMDLWTFELIGRSG